MASFKEKFNQRKKISNVCVGLDPDITKFPKVIKGEIGDKILTFNKAIINATKDYVAAYKPNAAFYEQYGLKGIETLQKTIDYIPDDICVILDAKRGDIGNTATAYAKAAFEDMKADAITLSPYMGTDSITPFLEYQDKYAFILALTSNTGANDFQKPDLYLKVSNKIKEWDDQYKNCGLVAGATQGAELKQLRELSDSPIFLVPGIGAQGGDLGKTINFVKGDNNNFLINSSRGIIYASAEDDFAKIAGEKAKKLQEAIISFL